MKRATHRPDVPNRTSLSLFPCYGPPRDLHSFPTRRSSDLVREPALEQGGGAALRGDRRGRASAPADARQAGARHDPRLLPGIMASTGLRSEEHTSELQSPVHLVCRLLLEKKNK